MSWLSKEDNRDNLVKGLCGTDYPGWYYALGGERAKTSDKK
jgi:hypothetical protein